MTIKNGIKLIKGQFGFGSLLIYDNHEVYTENRGPYWYCKRIKIGWKLSFNSKSVNTKLENIRYICETFDKKMSKK